MLPTYTIEDLGRIDIIFSDGVTDQVAIKEVESVEDMQERIKNLYSENFDDDALDMIVAYDYNGDRMSTITPDEFFGPLGGF